MKQDIEKMGTSRRKFLNFCATATVGTVFLKPKFAYSETLLRIGNDALPGELANTADIDNLISKLNNEFSRVSLANTKALQEECQIIVQGAQQSVKSARAALTVSLNEANSNALISSVGAALSGISFALLFVSTSPIWLVTAGGLMVAAAAVPFALSLNNASKSDNLGDGVVVATSFTSGRLSLIATGPGISTAARLTGRSFGALAAGVDAIFAIRDWTNVAQIRASLQSLEVEAIELRKEAERLKNDLVACREMRMTQIQESIDGLEYIKGLSALPTATTNPSNLILP